MSSKNINIIKRMVGIMVTFQNDFYLEIYLNNIFLKKIIFNIKTIFFLGLTIFCI